MTPDATVLAGRRADVYRALKDAGPDGLTETALHASAPLAGMHLSSLIAEGHSIDNRRGRDERGNPADRWVLTRDAWA